ncbi:hypothetical protein NUU61_006795 [Penicillium alfredii]|uniref:Uncharacterized protein n=1 Tax=Penicillium alfredii TaxID=1506179 RepID=A0A9W9F1M4_9EURO|nr:uncharacterized protein NUU61_006795 [Penicillium alfredii]KAJ5091925.1 hypothetical protein NUU61_006795 [Penicillium alfredii]
MIPDGKVGSCAGKPVDNTLQDAAQMADKGVSVLQDFVNDDMEDTGDKTVNYANMAYTMYAAKYRFYEDRGRDQEMIGITQGKERVEFALGYFQDVQDKLKSNQMEGRLMCGDKDLKLVHTLGDLGLKPNDQLLSDKIPDNLAGKDLETNKIKAFFLSRYWSPKDSNGAYILRKAYLIPVRANQYDTAKNGFCHIPHSTASMHKDQNLMILCDSIWTGMTLQRMLDRQPRLRKKLVRDQRGDYLIDQNKTPGEEFLHESFHWIEEDIIDQKIGEKKAYGFRLCFQLAKGDLRQKDPCAIGKSVNNADTHALFAFGVTLDKVNWYPPGEEEQGM